MTHLIACVIPQRSGGMTAIAACGSVRSNIAFGVDRLRAILTAFPSQEACLGKPLISDAAMRDMYRTMQAMRAAKRVRDFAPDLSRADRAWQTAAPESLVAAMLSQVHRRDTLLTMGSQPLTELALESYYPDEAARPALVRCPGLAEECAPVAAGIATRLAKGTRPDVPRAVTVALLNGFPPLTSVLRLMEQLDLSLVLVVQAEPESRADAQKRLSSTKIPILPVDDADAVAVCRVMQESMLRARNVWGGVVIHATRLPGAQDCVEGMQQRLRIRGLLPEVS